MRYKIVEGSQSAHCCFEYTIVDLEKLVVYNGIPYTNYKTGKPEYESICECFDKDSAVLILNALNEKV